jgi:hypothetical protein
MGPPGQKFALIPHCPTPMEENGKSQVNKVDFCYYFKNIF